jgi:hypothetical protein
MSYKIDDEQAISVGMAVLNTLPRVGLEQTKAVLRWKIPALRREATSLHVGFDGEKAAVANQVITTIGPMPAVLVDSCADRSQVKQ